MDPVSECHEALQMRFIMALKIAWKAFVLALKVDYHK